MGEGRTSAPPADPSASATPAQSAPGRVSQAGPDPLLGRVINDRFRIVSMMARGGMGKVYRAEQAPLGREVALKVLNPNYNGDQDPEFHRRFFLEASICSKLTHPNTVTIFDYGRTDDDVYFIAMELLEGRTLHRAIRDEGAFDPARALHVARQIARSLREAHAMGVVHRDLKPANVFLVRHGDESDFVKVLDFGLVKNVAETGEDLTQTGLFMGSPKYMAPEQIRGEKTDARSDIYALGVILYEMLTGKVPFDRSSSVNILMAHVHEAPLPFAQMNPNVRVPATLEALVMRALDKTPDNRFASMDELLVSLKGVATDSGAVMLTPAPSMELGLTGRFPPSELRVTGSGPNVAASPALGTPTAGTSVPPASVAPPAPAKFPTGLVAAGALGLAAIAVLAVVLSGSDPVETPEPTGTGSLPIEPPTVPSVPPDEPVAPARTLVRVTSEPTGATVRVDREGAPSRELGATPIETEWTGDDATRGASVTFVFDLEDHRSMSVTRTIGGDLLEVEAELEALRAERPYRPRPPRRPEGDDGTGLVGPVKGYKTDPY